MMGLARNGREGARVAAIGANRAPGRLRRQSGDGKQTQK
jgi:hypothetical protein